MAQRTSDNILPTTVFIDTTWHEEWVGCDGRVQGEHRNFIDKD